jgi:hypothetical protein
MPSRASDRVSLFSSGVIYRLEREMGSEEVEVADEILVFRGDGTGNLLP